VVADRDAEYLAQDLSPGVAARLAVLPVGADSPPPPPGAPPANPTLVLTGNLGYFPTADGAIQFLRGVWPLLAARRPELRLVLAGDRPGLALRRAAARGGPGVGVIDSPPELHTVLAGARIALAPARCGSGVPVKVLEAWAAGVPVVAHPYTAAGAGAEPGRELLTAADPAEWVAAIESLLDDAALARRLVAAGRQRLAWFKPARLCAELLDTIRRLKIAPGA
jgi:glycosyltransferase involved in cell wall biosynthesis